MFGSKGTTALSAAEYALLVVALRHEVTRLRADIIRHRDSYDPPAWARATTNWRLASSLAQRLEMELEVLPAQTAEERAWEAKRLSSLAERLPRSTANAALHHADVLARRKAVEDRRVAFWADKKKGRAVASPDPSRPPLT